MSPTPFVVSRFVNRNGITSWRVDGRIHGLRIRKNFKTRSEAGAEKAALDIMAIQSDSGVRTTTTRLSDEQLHEAEAAFRRLASAPKSLDFYLDYALTNYRAPEREITLEAAVAAYFGTKQKEHDNGMLSPCQLKDIRIISRRIV